MFPGVASSSSPPLSGRVTLETSPWRPARVLQLTVLAHTVETQYFCARTFYIDIPFSLPFFTFYPIPNCSKVICKRFAKVPYYFVYAKCVYDTKYGLYTGAAVTKYGRYRFKTKETSEVYWLHITYAFLCL